MILSGKVKLGKIPPPPPEWSAYRQRRMEMAMFCALLFFKEGRSIEEIKKKAPELSEVSKQRISQYVTKGMDFFIESEVFQGLPNA